MSLSGSASDVKIGLHVTKIKDMEEAVDNSNEDEDQSNSDDDISDKERTQIKAELTTMSFEDLIKLKQELGTKVYNSTIFGQKDKNKCLKKQFKRENKNRPREMSFKKPVSYKKNKVTRPQSGVRDPRFDANCGEFDRAEFKNRFSFVNEMKEKEIVELKTTLQHSKDPEEKKNIKLMIQRLENQTKEELNRKRKTEKISKEKDDVKKARIEGKNPHFVNKSQRKLQEMVSQFKELKETGKLQKHLERRRKKNASRDRKKIDYE